MTRMTVYGPSTGQNGRKPMCESCACSTSATGYMAPVRVKKSFKDPFGPQSMPCDYQRVLRALAFVRCPLTAQELNVTGALVINHSNDNQMVQIG